MPNGLTGDFDAVLQVSNALLDRLAAGMHQNGFPHPSLPSLPHEVHFRIEGPEHGSVAAQVGCPHVLLIEGATDRFELVTGFRARFRADPGSKPLADIINGTIRATYRIHDIDPTCPGWRGIADDYLWLKVIRSSVSFVGSAYNLSDHFRLTAMADEASLDARLKNHLTMLLADGFAPRPYPVGKRFKRFRSLVATPAPGRSGLAFPFALGDDEPAESLNTVGELFVDGHDFAVAVNRDAIVGAVAPNVMAAVGLTRSFHIHGDAGFGGGLEIDYHVRVDAADVTWLGAAPMGIPGGIIRITATGRGYATHLYRSGVFNIGSVSLDDIAMTFTVEQYLALQFDPSAGFSIGALGAPIANVHYTGPFAGEITAAARSRISNLVAPIIQAGLNSAGSTLDTYADADKLAGMVLALQSVDPAASVVFDRASYQPDGLVLHGSVRLASRRAPHVEFEKSATGDGFDAIASWIPGGRIDQFEWSWRFYTSPVQAAPGPPGAVTNKDTFELRRPYKGRNNFGQILGARKPLPGLDGLGRVCLTVCGSRVDPVTGAWVPVTSTPDCATFGYQFRLAAEMAPYLRLCDPSRADGGRAPEVGVVRIAAADADRAPNALVNYVGRDWDPERAAAAVSGLKACRREDAGLLVLALFTEGALDDADADTIAGLQRFSGDVVAPVLIAEDIGGRWAAHLGVDTSSDRAQWRLLGPDGVLRWAPESDFSAEELADVLAEVLRPSASPDFVRLRPDVDVGGRIHIDLTSSRCPPVSLVRPNLRSTRVLFADTGTASMEAAEWLAGQDDSAEELIAVVVRGASSEEARAVAARFGDNVPVVADPDGTTTLRAGISWTPSIVDLDTAGRVTEIVMDRAPLRPKGQRRATGARS